MEIIIISDSLKLSPGWEYNLNAIKNIVGTEDFLNLPDSSKNCQTETYDNCTTRSYVDRVIRKCGCLPLSMTIAGEQKETFCKFDTILNIYIFRFLFASLRSFNV